MFFKGCTQRVQAPLESAHQGKHALEVFFLFFFFCKKAITFLFRGIFHFCTVSLVVGKQSLEFITDHILVRLDEVLFAGLDQLILKQNK